MLELLSYVKCRVREVYFDALGAGWTEVNFFYGCKGGWGYFFGCMEDGLCSRNHGETRHRLRFTVG